MGLFGAWPRLIQAHNGLVFYHSGSLAACCASDFLCTWRDWWDATWCELDRIKSWIVLGGLDLFSRGRLWHHQTFGLRLLVGPKRGRLGHADGVCGTELSGPTGRAGREGKEPEGALTTTTFRETSVRWCLECQPVGGCKHQDS